MQKIEIGSTLGMEKGGRSFERQDCPMSFTTQSSTGGDYLVVVWNSLRPNGFPLTELLYPVSTGSETKEGDQHEGFGQIDPQTLGHIQSTLCPLQVRESTSVHHHQCLLTTSSTGDRQCHQSRKGGLS
jgi:hypothetical protein